MVNFSLFSQKAQEELASYLAAKNGTTPEDEAARMLKEESEQSNKTAIQRQEADRQLAEILELQEQQKTLTERAVNVNQQTSRNVNDLVKQAQTKAQDELQATPKIKEVINAKTIELNESLGFSDTGSGVQVSDFMIVEAAKLATSIFGAAKLSGLTAEQQQLVTEMEASILKLEKSSTSLQNSYKQFQDGIQGSNKTAKAAFAEKAYIYNTYPDKIKEYEIQKKFLQAQINEIYSQGTRLQVITQAFETQTQDLRRLLLDEITSAAGRETLRREISEGSALIEELIRSGLQINQNVVRELQIELASAAQELRVSLGLAQEKIDEVAKKPDSVFKIAGADLTNPVNSVFQDVFEDVGNIGAAVVNGFARAFNPTEDELVNQLITFQKAMYRVNQLTDVKK